MPGAPSTYTNLDGSILRSPIMILHEGVQYCTKMPKVDHQKDKEPWEFLSPIYQLGFDNFLFTYLGIYFSLDCAWSMVTTFSLCIQVFLSCTVLQQLREPSESVFVLIHSIHNHHDRMCLQLKPWSLNKHHPHYTQLYQNSPNLSYYLLPLTILSLTIKITTSYTTHSNLYTSEVP